MVIFIVVDEADGVLDVVVSGIVVGGDGVVFTSSVVTMSVDMTFSFNMSSCSVNVSNDADLFVSVGDTTVGDRSTVEMAGTPYAVGDTTTVVAGLWVVVSVGDEVVVSVSKQS